MRGDDPAGRVPDAQLVARARRGDERALSRLVERHTGTVYRVALSVVRDPDLAQDVAQEAFIKATRALQGFRGEASFRTWLVAIAVNEAKGALRRRGRRQEAPLEDAGIVEDRAIDPAQRAVRKSEADRARKYLQRLPEKQRMSVTLRIEEGLSFKEIGDAIGSSEGAARVNYFHGIRRLREWMA